MNASDSMYHSVGGMEWPSSCHKSSADEPKHAASSRTSSGVLMVSERDPQCNVGRSAASGASRRRASSSVYPYQAPIGMHHEAILVLSIHAESATSPHGMLLSFALVS